MGGGSIIVVHLQMEVLKATVERFYDQVGCAQKLDLLVKFGEFYLVNNEREMGKRRKKPPNKSIQGADF